MGNLCRRGDCNLYLANRQRKLEVIAALKQSKVEGFLQASDLNLRIFDVFAMQHSWSLLHYAVWLNDRQCVLELLDMGADSASLDAVWPSQHNESPISLAKRLNLYDIVNLFSRYPDDSLMDIHKEEEPFLHNRKAPLVSSLKVGEVWDKKFKRP